MFNFNGMPYKRSGRAGGRSVSMVSMLVLLLAALLVLPSCFDDDTETVEVEVEKEVEVPKNYCDGELSGNDGKDPCPEPEPMYDEVAEGTCEEGNDRHMGGDGDNSIAGTSGKDCIDGGKGNDSIKGMGDDDNITGGPGDDTIYGGDGKDKLDGGAGNDTLMGEAGDDELTGGSGDNTLDGGSGTDIAIYKDAMRVVVTLKGDERGEAKVRHSEASAIDPLVGGQDAGIGTDTLISIENVKGTMMGNDIINGDGNANLLKGLDGADTINGHGGDDTILPNRPVGDDGMANTAADDTPAGTDGLDVIDGGEGIDTISYQGESEAVTVNLGNVIPAIEDNEETDDDESRISHVAAQVGSQTLGDATTKGDTDRIAVVDIGTEDTPDVVSTIENVTGGFGADVLTGDKRDNTLKGGPGDDATLDGGAGNDMIMGELGDDALTGGEGDDTLMGGPGTNTYDGGPGDDHFVKVVGDDGAVTEASNGGMDTLSYVPMADDDDPAQKESEIGVGADATVPAPPNVEVVLGSPNADDITADGGGTTILGREGDDDLNGAAGVDTLVGCAGSNMLNGAGGNDNFGVFNDGDNATYDTIEDFTTGADDATMDEIHLKGFATGDITFAPVVLPGDSTTRAAVQVGGVTVAIVNSATIVAIADADPDMDGAQPKSAAEAIIDALGKKNSAGDDVVRKVDFDPAKCM